MKLHTIPESFLNYFSIREGISLETANLRSTAGLILIYEIMSLNKTDNIEETCYYLIYT